MSEKFNAWRGTTSKTPREEALAWQEDAACKGEPLSTFFPEKAADQEAADARAKELCSACEVRVACLDYSINQPERYGTWGNLNEDERADERKRRMRRDAATRAKEKKPKPIPKPAPKPAPQKRVSAAPSMHRVRAASAAGRPMKVYAHQAGLSESFISKLRAGRPVTVTEGTARRIRDAYPLVLAMDVVHPEPLGAAAMNGWPAPDAWVGVDMDDPDARPKQTANAA
jgi:WhiB family redox-sensing transcriptional regulator